MLLLISVKNQHFVIILGKDLFIPINSILSIKNKH
uniref:Uncharacterized protein n=1 Tax=Rhizophora mucronata TaxID=61149 RepID=A0A2P2PPI4_RHIMU